MKKIILIGVLLINICTTTSHAAERKSSLPWVAIPLLGAVMGFGYTYFYQWKEHPDIISLGNANESAEKAITNIKTSNSAPDSVLGFFQSVSADVHAETHINSFNKHMNELKLATSAQKRLLTKKRKTSHEYSQAQILCENIIQEARLKEFTEINTGAILKYSATGAGIGFGLVAVASVLK